MRLGINGWRLQWVRTGVARYLHNIVRHWTPETVGGRFDEITFYTPRPLDQRATPLAPGMRERVLRPNARMLVWENVRLGPTATDDVLFCPSYSIPLVRRGRTVVTTHEATLALYPEMYPRQVRLLNKPLHAWSARRATLVLTHTEAARRDISNCYGVPPEKVRVVPLAPAEVFVPVRDDARLADVRRRYLGTDVPYFLFVGKLTARRNIPKLLQAFAEVKRRAPLPHRLLIVGLNTTNQDLVTMAAALGITEQFRYVEYVPDDDLNLIYNAADVFVLPYTYEANSLTAVECQAVGTPVITTRTPGLDELTGGGAVLISQAEVPEIAEAMGRVAADRALRRELSEKGLAHAGRFSWERSARETLAVLHEAATLPLARTLPDEARRPLA